jgi:cytochrome b
MSAMHRLRAVHAALLVLVVASYISGEWGAVHAWLGYGVAAVILVRLALVFSGLPQLGLSRFYPHFAGLKLDNVATHPAVSRILLVAIAVLLLGTVATGIALDGGRVFGFADPVGTTAVFEAEDGDEGRADTEEEEGLMGEAHEMFANLLMLLVGVHVTYLLAFKRPLAKFMLFLERAGQAG